MGHLADEKRYKREARGLSGANALNWSSVNPRDGGSRRWFSSHDRAAARSCTNCPYQVTDAENRFGIARSRGCEAAAADTAAQCRFDKEPRVANTRSGKIETRPTLFVRYGPEIRPRVWLYRSLHFYRIAPSKETKMLSSSGELLRSVFPYAISGGLLANCDRTSYRSVGVNHSETIWDVRRNMKTSESPVAAVNANNCFLNHGRIQWLNVW